jgi:hypothetical protein
LYSLSDQSIVQNTLQTLPKNSQNTQKKTPIPTQVPSTTLTNTNMPKSGTSSRPTPGRGYQRLPQDAGVQAQYAEPARPEVPEWANGPFTLYISYLHGHVPEKMVFSVLRQTGLGMMRKNGAIELTKHAGRDGGYDFQSCKIHFDFLFTRGDDAERNIQTLDHLLHGGDDAHFQVTYQASRHNPKTGKDEPDRFWKVKAWKENMRQTPSPAGAPAIKITLSGGSIGPKDATRKPTATELRSQAARRSQQAKRTSPDADGFQKPKGRGGRGTVAVDNGSDVVASQSVGGGFAGLHVDEPGSVTPSPEPQPDRPMSKTAKKNARRAAKRAEQAAANPAATQLATEVAAAIAGGSGDPAPMTQAEMDEVDAAIAAEDPPPTNAEIVGAAAEFLAESQLREDGGENCGAWHMDASTGSLVTHAELTGATAAEMVAAAEVLDADAMAAAIQHAEDEAPQAQRAAGGVSDH